VTRRGRRFALAALALSLVSLVSLPSCAKKLAPPPPEGEEYLYPAPRPGELSTSDAQAVQVAWREVQVGSTVSAVKRYQKILKRKPRSPAARTGLGYAHLRGGELAPAGSAFVTVLEAEPQYLPALVGLGQLQVRRGEAEEAVRTFRRAAAAAPDDPLVRKRLASLKLQVTERRMAQAEAALERGDAEAAVLAYTAALEAAPEVTGVRLSLAQLLAARGDSKAALSVLEADMTGDRQLLLLAGRLLTEAGEYAQALEIYTRLLAHGPGDAEAREGQRRAQAGLESQALPEEYRAIPDAARLTRADLAALVAVRVQRLRHAGAGAPRVAVDISGSWARDQVARVLALGIMDVYPNHTFQPNAVVRRVDLARAAARTLDVLRWPATPSAPPSDMSRSHLDFAVVERVLGAGLMGVTDAGAFEPWRPVSGREAVEVVDALARLTSSQIEYHPTRGR
jgi:Flp pilus assembly protein TadD